jgi:capsular polysaccharide biosynthesis protein
MLTLRTKILGFALLLAGFALCGTGLWLLLSPAQYQATVRIEVGIDVAYDATELNGSRDYIKPTLDRIQSPVVLSNVWKSLNLNATGGDDMPEAIEFLHRQMSLQVIPNTTLIDISFLSGDPIEAARIANAVAKTYSDYRMERWKQFTRGVIRMLTEKYQQDEQKIKVKQESIGQLAKQLNLPNPEPPEKLIESNYPSYFRAKQQLEQLTEIHKVLAVRIEMDKSDIQIPNDPVIQIVDAARTPKFPITPNRWLGATLLAIGLFPTVAGFLLLKSPCSYSRT